jgi:very-short-patch-repair endonuclease
MEAMTAWNVDRAIEKIARRQHGVFSDRQARAVGGTTRVIGRRLATGRWIALDHHVYALPSHPGTWLRQSKAASLTIRGAAISHMAAAALHQLVGFRPGTPHIVVAPGSHHRTPLATVHESGWPQIGVVDRIRAVTMVDTFFQLAGCADHLRFRTAFEDAVVAHPKLLPALDDRYVELAFKRLPGIGLVRRLLDEHDAGRTPPHSELERLLDQLLDRVPELPPRRRQAPLPGWDLGEARVDTLVEDWRLIVEADGRRWHTRVADFERDRWRDIVATTHGYDILRFTYYQLTDGRDASLALLRRYACRRQATVSVA